MSREIIKIIRSEKQEIMPGRIVNAPLPTDDAENIETSPFVVLHHFGPFEVNYLNKFAFEPHPHRGFEAVTILFEGEMEHRDSTGSHGKLSGGDVQWMTAGSGVLHDEKQPQDFLEKGGIIHGIQLWINLPREFKMVNPGYQDIGSKDIPAINGNGVTERIIAGTYKSKTGAAKTYSPVTAIHGIMEKGAKIAGSIPNDQNMMIYVTKGKISSGGRDILQSEMAMFGAGDENYEITAQEPSEYLLLAGEPINEPVVQYGPFVMNTMGEIKQAFLDYREGKFGTLN
ncbi:MAG: pirin family protein [Ignavibacteria bacterium]|nr:pirin family protein [Ignavibacteria bacterium]MCC7158324.1 pirin family protein [Ignavibacteria bacterium]